MRRIVSTFSCLLLNNGPLQFHQELFKVCLVSVCVVSFCMSPFMKTGPRQLSSCGPNLCILCIPSVSQFGEKITFESH